MVIGGLRGLFGHPYSRQAKAGAEKLARRIFETPEQDVASLVDSHPDSHGSGPVQTTEPDSTP
jgi:hypothetical protein